MPQHSDVHVDRPLSNYAVEYRNQDFIASLVAPFVPVNNKSDTYITFNKADRFSLPEDLRGPKDAANEITWGTGTGTYACKDRALRDFLTDYIVGNSDPAIKPEQRTTNFLTQLLMLGFEYRVSTLVFTSGNYSGSYKSQLSGTTQFSDFTNSDPIGVIDTGKEACFYPPNTMIMGEEVYNKLKRHPQLLDHVKGGSTSANPAMVSMDVMKEVFEIPNILIGKAKYNSAKKGQTATYTRLWGKSIVLAYIDASVTLDNLSAFKTFRWTQPTTDVGYKVRRYRNEEKGGGGQYIEVETSLYEAAICTDIAYLIYDAIA
ncbi:MAG: hypothetical protein WCY09_09305 [Candidatus Omnitrophota bacterium]|jgi:hypothetical protein